MNASRTLVSTAALLLSAAATAQPAAWSALDGPHAAGLRTAAISAAGPLLTATHVDVLRNAGAGWTEVAGAVNGSIHDIASGPGGRVWAGTSGALRSDDGGQTWQWFSIRTAPHSGTHPTVLHVAQGPDGTVYAGGYRSHDAGATWPQMSIYAVATAFIGGTVWAGSFDGIYRSTNSGGTWAPSGLEGIAVSHMAVTGTRLIAATSFGIAVSDDGQTWEKRSALADIAGFAVSGDGAVWAATPGGLLRSPNGDDWSLVAFIDQPVFDIAARGSELLALVEGNPYRSLDGGATWNEVRDGLGLPFATSAFADGGTVAVSVVGAGPFRSNDAGATWTEWEIGLTSPLVYRMLAMPSLGLAFAHGPAFVYRATLGGGPWTAVPLPDGLEPGAMASDGTTLFAVADSGGFVQHIYRSTDGATWTPAHTETDSFMPHMDAGGSVVVVSAAGFVGSPRLLVSSDGGLTWASRPHPTAPSFGAAPPHFVDSAGRIYVQDSNTLVRSTDLGASWTTLGAIGPATNSVTTVHADDAALCAGTSMGVWCSTDEGATFAQASAGLPGGGAVQVKALVRDGSRYFALTAEDGVFASDAVTAGPPTQAPTALALTASPNPTSGSTAVTLDMPREGEALAAVFDALGRRVAVLYDGLLATGRHTFGLDAARLPAGVYTVRVSAGGGVATQRVVVAR